MSVSYPENTESVIFPYNLKLEHRYIGHDIRTKIRQMVDNTTFIKETFCVLYVNDIKILNVKHTKAQSDCVASLEINAQCLVPLVDKVFIGIVTNVIENQLSVVTVEKNIDVIVKGQTIKRKNDPAKIMVLSNRFVNGKIFCMGKFI
jgi:hypothetical protein